MSNKINQNEIDKLEKFIDKYEPIMNEMDLFIKYLLGPFHFLLDKRYIIVMGIIAAILPLISIKLNKSIDLFVDFYFIFFLLISIAFIYVHKKLFQKVTSKQLEYIHNEKHFIHLKSVKDIELLEICKNSENINDILSTVIRQIRINFDDEIKPEHQKMLF